MPTTTIPPGHLGNLTSPQQLALQQTWAHLLRLTNRASPSHPSPSSSPIPDLTPTLLTLLPNPSPSTAQTLLWSPSFFLSSHPDLTILRFLRARSFSVAPTLSSLLSTLTWRSHSPIPPLLVHSDSPPSLSPSPPPSPLTTQYVTGKTYLHASELSSRPVIIIRAVLHDPKAQSEEEMEAFILHFIETVRTMLTAEVETVCLVFDMKGFGMRNMDFGVVRFLVKVFEERYPEYLGVLIVHEAPVVFSGIWRVIKPLLDPVIASKIHFTKTNLDLQRFIAPENLQTRYGGVDGWEYRYFGPVEGENERMGSEKKEEIEAEREELIEEFLASTAAWVALDPQSAEGRRKGAERDELADRLGKVFWQLDPYVRARTHYHRAGVIDNGVIDFKAAK